MFMWCRSVVCWCGGRVLMWCMSVDVEECCGVLYVGVVLEY